MNQMEYLTNAHNLFVNFHTIANIVSEVILVFCNSSVSIISSVYTSLVALQLMVIVEIMQPTSIHFLSSSSHLKLLWPGCNIATLLQYEYYEKFSSQILQLGPRGQLATLVPQMYAHYATLWIAPSQPTMNLPQVKCWQHFQLY